MLSLLEIYLLLLTFISIKDAASLSPALTRSLKKLVANTAATILSTAPIINGVACYAVDFTAPDGSFTFRYPESFKVSEKMLGLTVKTHEYEVFLKSEYVKGFNAGVTVDKVKIKDIREFSSPVDLAARVIDVEKKKDADWYIIEPRRTKVLDAVQQESSPISYILNYQVDSSRGFKRYIVKTAVNNKMLYVFTVQCNEESFDEVKPLAMELIDSFSFTSAS